VTVVRLAINTLAGVPSIVFGLFGLTVFVNMFGFGVSLLSGACTLCILILPIIINASEEAFKAVPQDFREAAYALGATKRQAILKVVLPTALPNILTGAIISVGRAAGETAPILFTAATFYNRHLPGSPFDEVMALPYHIYALMTEGTSPKFQVPIAYGTSIVLLLLVLSVNAVAIIIRYNLRRKKQW
jgi:phosphate transport system permease protein